MPRRMPDWSPESWQDREVRQAIAYPDPEALSSVLDEISILPPLVTSWEIDALRRQLGEAALGKRFLLQGGDCAERFGDCRSDVVASRLKVLLQMSVVLVYGLRMPVVRVGRFAGQYAKPRSSPREVRGAVSLPSYRGDNVNGDDFTEEARRPDPQRLMTAYRCSAMILNFVRSLSDGGFADLHNVGYWNLSFAARSPHAKEYQSIVRTVRNALQFASTVAEGPLGGLGRVDFYTSHEALHLPFEQALTRYLPHRSSYYDLSTHFPWIGMRTNQLDGAHVEFMRGILNPVAVKVGPEMTPGELQRLIRHLDPENTPGRLTLITRFGTEHIEKCLPPLAAAARRVGSVALWCCDPMHGNTLKAGNGRKTRRFDHILAELERAFDIHLRAGTILGGVHFELTGEDVTECVGGSSDIREADLHRAYHSRVDPRLNAEQSLEMALRIVQKCQRAGIVA